MRILFVGWDRATWRDLHPLADAGRLPTLTRLIESGCSGALRATPPLETPALWGDVLTGRTPDVHRVLAYGDVPRTPMVAELAGDATVCGWTCGDVEGATVSDTFALPPAEPHGHWPIPADSVRPAQIEPELLALRLEAADFTGGDLLPFLPDLDARWTLPVAAALAETATLHACATWLMEHHPSRFFAARYPFAGRLKQAGVPAEIIERAWPLMDAMLARLLDLSGPDTLVVLLSEGGHTSPEGVICWSGPAFTTDTLVFGARAADVAPTLLALLRKPIPEDLPGRVLTEIFREAPEARRERRAHAEDPEMFLQALASEGYAPPEAGEREVLHVGCALLAQGRQADAEREFLKRPESPLGRLYLAAAALMQRDPERAARYMQSLPQEHGWKSYERVLRGWVLHGQGRWGEALELVQGMENDTAQPTGAKLLLGDLYWRCGRLEDARRSFVAAAAHVPLARLYLSCGEWQRAADSALDAIAEDAVQPLAHRALGQALLRMGRKEEAARAFETAARFAGSAHA